jgi:hypothetical protein
MGIGSGAFRRSKLRHGMREKTPLYQRGFVRVAQDNRHFEHADGAPFFWLGDTGGREFGTEIFRDWVLALDHKG